MESPSSLPKPLLPKSAFTPTSSHLQTSYRSSTAIPRLLPKIKEKSLETDFLAVSECSLSDLPDPLIISGQSASDLPLLSRSSDTTEEQKRCLLGNALDDINQAKDILIDTKKIMDAMLEVAVLQLNNGTDSARRAARVVVPYDLMIKLRIATLFLFTLVLVVRLVFKHCIGGDDEWPHGFAPT